MEIMSSAAYAKDSQYCLYIAKFLRTQEGRGLFWGVHVWRVGVGHFAKGSPAWQITSVWSLMVGGENMADIYKCQANCK